MKSPLFWFRMALRTFALGFAAFYMWKGLSIASSEVSVDLPPIQSGGDVLVIFPATQQDINPYIYNFQKAKIIGDRDISLYDIGEYSDECSWVSGAEHNGCLVKRRAAKQFVTDHLVNKRRGYIEIGLPCVDCSPVYHVFIEPDLSSGLWHFSITLATNGPGRTSRGHIVKLRTPTSDERMRGQNNEVLSFIDDSGKEVASFQ
jgi:hypothetical protein